VISRLVSGLAGLFLVAVVACWPSPALATGHPTVGLPGEKREGSTDAGQPTKIEAGTWRGTVGPAGSAEGLRYYAYRRTIPESTVHVSVLGKAPEDTSGDLGLKVTTAGGEDCESSQASAPYDVVSSYAASVDVGVLPTDGPGATPAASPSDGPEELDECVTSDTLYIAVDRGYATDATDTVDLALTVVEEARVKSAKGLPPGVELPDFTEPDVLDSDATDLAGATSYNEAPEIESGAYAGSLQTGEALAYRVHAGWGQTVNASLVVNAITGADGEKVGSYGPGVGVTIVSPLFSSDRTSNEDDHLKDSEYVTAQAVSGPIRFLNREDGEGPWLPGDYYVVVGSEPLESGRIDFGYTLKVDVSGAVEGGSRLRHGQAVRHR